MQQSVNKVAGILMLLVFICVGTTLLSENFTKPGNIENIVRYSAEYGIIGIGVALVIITGGIDLSIGSVIGLVGCLLPMFLIDKGWPVAVSLLAVVMVSACIGLAHGLLITKARLQPFIVTLCGLLIYRGVSRGLTSDNVMGFGSQYDDSLRLLATGTPCTVPFLMLLAGIVLVVLSVWRWWRSRPTADDARATTRTMSLVLLIIGLTLVAIGGSRFAHGYGIKWGPTLISLGPLSLPSWETVLFSPRGEEHPRELMTWAGWLVLPGIVWLLVTLFGSAPATRDGEANRAQLAPTSIFLPLVSAILGGLSVWAVRRMVRGPDEELPGGEEWALTWEIIAVFAALGLLMGSLAWLGRRAIGIAGRRAVPPMLLAAAGAILWLMGQTQLNVTAVPMPAIFLLVLAGLASVFLNQTIYGRYLLALGNNEEAARFSGIQTDRMILLAYVLCSLIAGLGGILFALDTNTIQPQSHGNFYELYAIAAAVLGGCSLRGGEGTILGVVIGAAVMRVLYNSINLIGIPSQLEFAIIGVVILLGVLADEIVKRIVARRRAEA